MEAKQCPKCGNPMSTKRDRCYYCKPAGRPPAAPPINGQPHEPAGAAARKKRVVWTRDERAAVLARAIEIRERTGLLNTRRLFLRAMTDVLPPDRRVTVNAIAGERGHWFREPILALPPLSVAAPAPEPEKAPEPVPEPLPPLRPVHPDILLDEITTRDLVTVLAGRLYDMAAQGLAGLQAAAADLDRRQRKDHALLRRVVSDLDPSYLAPQAKPAPSHQPPKQDLPPTPSVAKPVVTPPPAPAPAPKPAAVPLAAKIKIAVVGVRSDQISTILKGVGSLANVVCLTDPEQASRRGFRKFDQVILNASCAHKVRARALSDVGSHRVRRIPAMSAAACIEEIRRAAAAQ